MKYYVSGAHAVTGRDMAIMVEAGSDAQAERMARDQGMLVSKVASELAAQTTGRAIPEYQGLKSARLYYLVFSILCYVAGVGFFVFAVVQLIELSGPLPDYIPVKIAFSLAGGCLMWGGLLQGMAAACVALRDIARNSFNH